MIATLETLIDLSKRKIEFKTKNPEKLLDKVCQEAKEKNLHLMDRVEYWWGWKVFFSRTKTAQSCLQVTISI